MTGEKCDSKIAKEKGASSTDVFFYTQFGHLNYRIVEFPELYLQKCLNSQVGDEAIQLFLTAQFFIIMLKIDLNSPL